MSQRGVSGDGVGHVAADFVRRLAARSIRSGRPLCFDSSALIDYFAGNDPIASLLRPLLKAPEVAVVVSTISLAELITRPAMANEQHRVDAIHAALLALPGSRIVGLDERHALETAFVRAETGLKLPDAAIVATARLAGASALLGNDRRWRTTALGVPYHHIGDILIL